MGLFSKAPRCNDVAWTNTSRNDNAATLRQFSAGGSREKRAFSNSAITSQESKFSYTSLTPPASPGSDGRADANAALFQKVHMLEQQLQQKDAVKSQLDQAMEIEAKVQSERIELLEQEVNYLVELSSKDCSRRGKKNLSSGSHKKKKIHENDNEGIVVAQEVQAAKYEISALECLLGRVLAEKDQLRCENDNLKRILQDCDAQASCCHFCPIGSKESYNKIPPSIKELDSVVGFQEQKKINKVQDCRHDHRLSKNGQCQRKENEIKIENDPQAIERPEEEQNSVLYQLTCRSCHEDHSRLKFRGTYNTDDVASSSRDARQKQLSTILMKQFTQVWKMVQEEKEKGSSSSSIHGDECNRDLSNSSIAFLYSPLARYLVKHCQYFTSEDEVLKWCRENIKVEVQTRVPPGERKEKMRRSKSSNKRTKDVTEKGDEM